MKVRQAPEGIEIDSSPLDRWKAEHMNIYECELDKLYGVVRYHSWRIYQASEFVVQKASVLAIHGTGFVVLYVATRNCASGHAERRTYMGTPKVSVPFELTTDMIDHMQDFLLER